MDTHCNKDLSCEPMDVDLSTNSAHVSVIESEDNPNQSFYENTQPKIENKPEVWNMKTYHIVRDKTPTKSNTILYIFGVVALVLSIITYCLLGINCMDSLDTKELRYKLENRLHGQPEVIDSLVNSLEVNVASKILFLYGGTGVGKTFTISLVLENYLNCTNVYHFLMPSFLNTFSTDTLLGLNVCESSIVIVDDLEYDDFNVKDKIVEIINKSRDLNKKITIILIYNCDVITPDFRKKCTDTFYTELTQTFNDIEAFKSFIKFKPLTQDTLKMCIKDELSKKNSHNVDLNSILGNFNVFLDGCKGVHKKIKFLNMS